MLAFGVLGPLEVVRDGRTVHVNGPKQRALLATLLLRANTTVPVSVIITRLWGEDPPPASRKTVQMYVLRLRRLLDDSAVIETHPEGYLLRLRPDALDLTRFRDAVRAARTAEPPDEPALLATALHCWRGPVLDDVASEPLLREDVTPLAEELLRVRERFFEVSWKSPVITSTSATPPGSWPLRLKPCWSPRGREDGWSNIAPGRC